MKDSIQTQPFELLSVSGETIPEAKRERSLRLAPALRWLLVGVGLISMGGCRFGNRVTQAERPESFSGYYRTAPQSLNFCAIHSVTDCAAAAVNQIPSLIANVMTNPVALISRDESSGSAYLAASDESGYALPVTVSVSDSSLSYVGQTSPATLWDDPACTTRLYVDESGSFTKSSSAGTLAGKPLSGSLAVTLSLTRTFDGSCSASLTAMKACYENESQCGGSDAADNADLHAGVAAFFDPYIQAGVMSAADITALTVLAYEVVYR